MAWTVSLHRTSALHRTGLAPKKATCSARSPCIRTLASAAPQQKRDGPLVKICGITNAEDAQHAVQSGADLLGMIMWQKAKRAVSADTARAIAAVARGAGAKAVGVFVDEDAATISARCRDAQIPIAQLHGDGARAALPDLDPTLEVVYVLNCAPDGTPLTPPPSELLRGLGRAGARLPDWVLVDSAQGGSGQALDWRNLKVPAHEARQGWLLAGGLNPDNVATAAGLAQPSAVDVSSGVCGPDGLKKDHGKVSSFISSAKAVKYH
ncbi:hypothetical protein CHLRE_12g519000v5 [Chlamydomonas reinhardtii]|uniref:phosphoribosylanthranilate isomerase n=1 Tax=Chlamydomonas reinhardtii TaxID=3055 RepID=A8J650_CHLRE|nr:uncharacterized protein CHLRE_12g519000v5 [Chlamydomonas reinhardtii]PNW75248.1 hypothetical protein CHLRE_12g519000v5 [Chlamydomonas reinhardtii]|eukprot:XP_001696946.1 phosphoribosylanthranilate isomerase [Chlamydomonas reinhardtii]